MFHRQLLPTLIVEEIRRGVTHVTDVEDSLGLFEEDEADGGGGALLVGFGQFVFELLVELRG